MKLRAATWGKPSVWVNARTGAASLLVAASMGGQCSCGTKPTRPPEPVVPEPIPPSTSPYRYVAADWPQAWSHDGRTIAFRRVVPSRDGPPGIYLIAANGGRPRYLTAASFFFPTDLAFSPDDRLLVGSYGVNLVTIDVGSAQKSLVVHSQNLLRYPQWSHSGRYIVYSYTSRFYNQPPESSGIHIYDASSGTDQPLRGTNGVCDGIFPQWSPGDSAIAYVDWQRRPKEVAALELVGGTRRTLLPGLESIWGEITNLQFWPAHGGPRTELLACIRPDGSPSRWVAIGFRDTATRTFPYTLGEEPSVRLSPDGKLVVYHAYDPRDSVFVLFVRDLAANTTTGRQLTSCEPPASATSEVGGRGVLWTRTAMGRRGFEDAMAGVDARMRPSGR